MRIKPVMVGGLVAVILTTVVALAQRAPVTEVGGVQVGSAAPDFELTGVDGKAYRLSDYADRVVVLEWWNQDCPVSRKYIPTMKKLAAENASKGVVWLAIDSTHYQTPAKDKEFMDVHGIAYPVLMDTAGQVGRLYGAKCTPHMFVINKGQIAYDGAIESKDGRNYVAEALGAVLAGKPVPLARTQPFGCSVKYGPAAPTADSSARPGITEIGKPAPDFVLKGVDGKEYRLAEFKDKLVVLEWWNQDCPFTRRYTPLMKQMATGYAKRGVIWLAIDSTHYQTAAKDGEYHRAQAMVYPILMDTDGRVGRTYQAKTSPHMFVINKGTLAYAGAIDNQGDRNYVAEALDALLAGREVPLAKTQPFGCSVKYKK
jgi:peroxiredoxin